MNKISDTPNLRLIHTGDDGNDGAMVPTLEQLAEMKREVKKELENLGIRTYGEESAAITKYAGGYAGGLPQICDPCGERYTHRQYPAPEQAGLLHTIMRYFKRIID